MKATIVSIFLAAALIVTALIFSKGGASEAQIAPGTNVSVVNGVQIIEIRARGGYNPRVSVAKAGIPTILRFDTGGTFDCSASVRIPSLNVSKILPQSGNTDIDIGTNKVGTLNGMCGMGMYPFQINFQS